MLNRFTKIHDANGIQVYRFDNAELGVEQLLGPIETLSTDVEPQEVDKVVYANTPAYRWGKSAFVKGNMFVKAFWTCRHLDRELPLLAVARLLGNHARCADLGLPVPELLGAFARLDEEGWMWNGVLVSALSGWRTLDAVSEADMGLLAQARAVFAAAGVVHLDLSPSNVMTDGEGQYKVVDLDMLRDLPSVCTKYELVNALKALDPALLETLRTAYAGSPDMQFYWNTVQELDRHNADFQAFAGAVNATEAQLDQVFWKIAVARG